MRTFYELCEQGYLELEVQGRDCVAPFWPAVLHHPSHGVGLGAGGIRQYRRFLYTKEIASRRNFTHLYMYVYVCLSTVCVC